MIEYIKATKHLFPNIKYWVYKRDYLIPKMKRWNYYDIGYDRLIIIEPNGHNFPLHMSRKRWVTDEMVYELIKVGRFLDPTWNYDFVLDSIWDDEEHRILVSERFWELEKRNPF